MSNLERMQNDANVNKTISSLARIKEGIAYVEEAKTYTQSCGIFHADYDKAKEKLERAIAFGNVEAYLVLSDLYSDEHKLGLDYEKVFELCTSAVKAGHQITNPAKNKDQEEEIPEEEIRRTRTFMGIAYYRLANAYYFGKGVKRDQESGERMFQTSETYGCSAAAHALIAIYLGLADPKRKNIEAAREYLSRLALNSNDQSALFIVSAMFLKGNSELPQDIDKAVSGFRTVSSEFGLALAEEVKEEVEVKRAEAKKAEKVLKGSTGAKIG